MRELAHILSYDQRLNMIKYIITNRTANYVVYMELVFGIKIGQADR